MRTRTAVLVVAALVLLSSMGAGANVTVDTEKEPESAVMQIDPSTTIEEMTWTSDGVTLVFSSKIPRRIMLTDMYSLPDAGAGEVRFKRTQLQKGKTEVFMQATQRRGDQAVSIMVGDTMVAVSDPTKPFLTDPQPRHVAIGAASSTILILGVLYILYRRKKRKDKTGVTPSHQF